MKYTSILSNFTFKKDTPYSKYELDGTPSTQIKINKEQVGYIYTDDGWNGSHDGKFKVRLMIPASEKALKKNPNRKWTWGKLSVEFNSEQEARDFLKKNFNKLIKQIYISKEKS